MKVIHNNKEITALQGISFTESLLELNTATIVFHVDNFLGKVGEYIEVDNKGYLIGTISKQTISRMNSVNKYVLTLIECTKFAEKIILPTQAFTNKTDTLLNIFQKLIKNTYYSTNRKSVFVLSQRLIDKIKNVQGEDFVFTKPNLREVCDELLDIVDCRLFIAKIGEQIELDYIDKAQKNKFADFKHTFTSEETQTSIEFQANNIQITAENALEKTRRPLTHGWDVFKSLSGNILTTENTGFTTLYPIELITEFVVKVRYQMAIYGPWETVDLDITRKVIPQELYDIMTTNEKRKYLPYSRGENKVDTSKKTNVFWFIYSTINIEEAILDELRLQKYIGEAHSPYAFNPPMLESPFKLKYYPYLNVTAEISKQDNNSEFEKMMTMTDIQSEKAVDLARYAESTKRKLELLNKTKRLSATIYAAEQLHDLGDTVDSLTIVTREYSVYNNYIVVNYDLVENYVPVPVRTKIDRERRLYDISLTSLSAMIIYKNYINLGRKDRGSDDMARGFLNLGALRTFMRVFEPQPITKMIYTKSIDRVIIQNLDDTSQRYMINCSSFILSNNICFSFRMMDNYSVAFGVGKKILGGREVAYNPYVDDNGETNNLQFTLLYANSKNELSYNELKLLPQISQQQIILDRFSNDIKLNYFKDQKITLGATFQVETRKNTEENSNFIVTYLLCSQNPLISDDNRNTEFFISNELYVNTDKIAKGVVRGQHIIKKTINHNFDVGFNDYVLHAVEEMLGDVDGGLYQIKLDGKYYLCTYEFYNLLYPGIELKYFDYTWTIDKMAFFRLQHSSFDIDGKGLVITENLSGANSWAITDGYGRILIACNKENGTLANRVYIISSDKIL